MKKLCFALLISCAFTQVEALLPPLYQTSSEIQQMMADQQLGQKLQAGEVIEKIEKNAHGYEIITNKSRVQVVVEYEPAQRPGPAHFRFHFGNPTSLPVKS